MTRPGAGGGGDVERAAAELAELAEQRELAIGECLLRSGLASLHLDAVTAHQFELAADLAAVLRYVVGDEREVTC